MNLIIGETIAIDSFKIRAQNSFKNNFNQKKTDRHPDYIDNKIEEYQKQLDDNDQLDKDQVQKIEDNIEKTMGIYSHSDERKRKCTFGSEPGNDLLQS